MVIKSQRKDANLPATFSACMESMPLRPEAVLRAQVVPAQGCTLKGCLVICDLFLVLSNQQKCNLMDRAGSPELWRPIIDTNKVPFSQLVNYSRCSHKLLQLRKHVSMQAAD